jgi:hypothetical protein
MKLNHLSKFFNNLINQLDNSTYQQLRNYVNIEVMEKEVIYVTLILFEY